MQTSHWFGFTVDDVALDGYATETHLSRVLEFCAEQQVRATFFAVPLCDGKRLDQRRQYVAILREAVAAGHEVAQHGLAHDRFEVGIPPEMVLALPHEGPARNYLAECREQIDASHSVALIREKLRTGRRIIEDAIAGPVHGFRAPALQSCENMFIALAEEQYAYDSSTYLQKAGWDLINGLPCIPHAINQERFAQAQKGPALRELPLTAEYTWYLGKDKFAAACQLAVHDFDACMKAKIPFVNVCHVSPLLEGEGDCGLELYRRLFQHIREFGAGPQGAVPSLTLSEIASKIS
jgi:predicted deacetylase